MNWSEFYEKWDLKGLFILLMFILAVRLLLRPRKPKVIHAHFNRMLYRIGFLPVATVLLGVYVFTLFIYSLRIIPQDSFVADVVFPLLLIGYVGFNTVYVGYWSQPFSRKKTGVQAVDEAIARYKKPGERVADAWVPALVLNGKRYRNAFYIGKGRQWIVLDEQGEILRDEPTAHTVRNMLRLALQTAHPAYINERTDAYTSSQKGIKGMNMLLEQYERLMEPVRGVGGAKYEDEIAMVRKAAEAGLRFQEGMCAYWMIEAEWGNRRGGTRLREVRFEEWKWLIDRLHEKTLLWLCDEIETLQDGAEAARKISRLSSRRAEIGKRSPELKYLLEAVIEQENDLREGFDDLRAGRVRGYERGLDLDEDELKGWRSRLEWVRQVDEWYQQGLSEAEIKGLKEGHGKQAKGQRRSRR